MIEEPAAHIESGKDWRKAVTEQERQLVERILKVSVGRVKMIVIEDSYLDGIKYLAIGGFAGASKNARGLPSIEDVSFPMLINLTPGESPKYYTQKMLAEEGGKALRDNHNVEIVSFQRLPKKCSEYVPGMSSEPAIAIVYDAHPGTDLTPKGRNSPFYWYTVGGWLGSPTNGITFYWIVSQSDAHEFYSALKGNPSPIRPLAEPSFRSS